MDDLTHQERMALADQKARAISNIIMGVLIASDSNEGDGVNGLAVTIERIALRSTDPKVHHGVPILLREIAQKIEEAFGNLGGRAH